MIEKIRIKNPSLTILSVEDDKFSPYGIVHDGYNVDSIVQYMEERPLVKDLFINNDPYLSQNMQAHYLSQCIFGQLECSIGSFIAQNQKMNAMEYHRHSELLVTASPLILILSHISKIHNSTFRSSEAEIFYAPVGKVIELFATTLHFAPCAASVLQGVRQAVILLKGTNTPLDKPLEKFPAENKLLFQKNKWLLAHPEASDLLAQGAYAGINGDNITIVPLS